MPMVENSKRAIEHSGRNNNLREATMQASSVIISLVEEAASHAPCAELQKAAAAALIIFEAIQVYKNLIDLWLQLFNSLQAVKDNKEAYRRLGDDSATLIISIWRSYKEAKSPNEWLSTKMQEILEELIK